MNTPNYIPKSTSSFESRPQQAPPPASAVKSAPTKRLTVPWDSSAVRWGVGIVIFICMYFPVRMLVREFKGGNSTDQTAEAKSEVPAAIAQATNVVLSSTNSVYQFPATAEPSAKEVGNPPQAPAQDTNTSIRSRDICKKALAAVKLLDED